MFSRTDIAMNGLEKGDWSIECNIDERFQIIVLTKTDVKKVKFQTTSYVHNIGKHIPHIMFCQTNIDNIKISEETVLAHGCHITSKGNMIIRNHHEVRSMRLKISKTPDTQVIKIEIILRKKP